jgi:prepilin-type N-terminal cleavage/methylation domain-containing protein
MRKRLSTNKYRITRGFTLIEIIIVLMLISVLMSVSSYIYIVSLKVWGSGRLRTEIREDMNYALERAVRYLKETPSLSQYNSIDHTIQYDDLSGNTYVFYLYNEDDGTLDSVYSESSYNLYKADIDSGDDPSSGEGVIILTDLVSPDAVSPATSLAVNLNQATLDIVVQRSDELVRLRTIIRPRNL